VDRRRHNDQDKHQVRDDTTGKREPRHNRHLDQRDEHDTDRDPDPARGGTTV
jgi:hypothetical protein